MDDPVADRTRLVSSASTRPVLFDGELLRTHKRLRLMPPAWDMYVRQASEGGLRPESTMHPVGNGVRPVAREHAARRLRVPTRNAVALASIMPPAIVSTDAEISPPPFLPNTGKAGVATTGWSRAPLETGHGQA